MHVVTGGRQCGKTTHDEIEDIFSEAVTHAIFYIVGVDVTK